MGLKLLKIYTVSEKKVNGKYYKTIQLPSETEFNKGEEIAIFSDGKEVRLMKKENITWDLK